jgi:transposase
MPKRPSLSLTRRVRIIELLYSGSTYREIAVAVDRSKSACQQAVKLFEETVNYIDCSRSGRP